MRPRLGWRRWRRRAQTIGNLTLLTGSLNASLSNRPWLDRDAAVAAPTGREAGKGKRSLINKYSLLVLNKEIVQEHGKAWTEEDIIARGQAIASDIATIWPTEGNSMGEGQQLEFTPE